MLLGCTSVLRWHPGLFPLHDVKKTASQRHDRALNERKLLLFKHGRIEDGGASRDRTDDLKLAKLPLSQLSYGPDPNGIHTEAHFQPYQTRVNGGPGKI